VRDGKQEGSGMRDLPVRRSQGLCKYVDNKMFPMGGIVGGGEERGERTQNPFQGKRSVKRRSIHKKFLIGGKRVHL